VKLFSGTPLSQFSDQPAHPPAEAATADQPKAKTGAGRPGRAPGPAPAIPEPQAATSVRVVPLARLAAGGRWRIEAMRSISEPLLLWFTRGQGRITVGGVTRGYGVHNAVFIPAGVMHGYDSGAQTYGSAVFFGRGCTLDLPATAQHLRVRDAGPQAELSALVDNIQREIDSGKPGANRAAQHYLGLLGVWLERNADAGQDQAKKPDSARRLAARYTEILEHEFRSGKGVADFARALGVTPTHLTRVCNQTCGRSASDLLHDRLIFEARLMLSETKLPVARIAETLGFNSAAYFTRAFQQRTGKTPTAFRRSG
jgi:AraC-like DNA-binding protein